MIDLGPRRLQIFGNAARLSASIPTIARARKAVIPKTIGNIRIDTPPENAVTLRAVRFISNKQLKLFQIPKPLKHMKRELKPEEHKEIVSAVAAGDRIKAMNIYLSATEGNLTEAQNYLKTVTAKAELAESERS